MPEISTVGVVGAGTMGSGIAHVFARSGFNVLLCDVEERFLDRALGQIRANLGRESAKGKLPESEIEPALGGVTTTIDREALAARSSPRGRPGALRPEGRDLPLPRPYPAGNAVLASNTSSISITRLAAPIAVRAGDRDALLQSRAGDGAGGGGARPGDQRRDLRRSRRWR